MSASGAYPVVQVQPNSSAQVARDKYRKVAGAPEAFHLGPARSTGLLVNDCLRPRHRSETTVDRTSSEIKGHQGYFPRVRWPDRGYSQCTLRNAEEGGYRGRRPERSSSHPREDQRGEEDDRSPDPCDERGSRRPAPGRCGRWSAVAASTRRLARGYGQGRTAPRPSPVELGFGSERTKGSRALLENARSESERGPKVVDLAEQS